MSHELLVYSFIRHRRWAHKIIVAILFVVFVRTPPSSPSFAKRGKLRAFHALFIIFSFLTSLIFRCTLKHQNYRVHQNNSLFHIEYFIFSLDLQLVTLSLYGISSSFFIAVWFAASFIFYDLYKS